MTKDEAIKYSKEQLDVFGGKHAEFIKFVIELLEQGTIGERLTEEEKDRPTFDMLEEVKNMDIKALEKPMQRWVPVSERLPENEGLYLVSVKNDHQRLKNFKIKS